MTVWRHYFHKDDESFHAHAVSGDTPSVRATDEFQAVIHAAKSDRIFKDAKMAKVHAQKALQSEDPIIRNQANDILNSLNESE